MLRLKSVPAISKGHILIRIFITEHMSFAGLKKIRPHPRAEVKRRSVFALAKSNHNFKKDLIQKLDAVSPQVPGGTDLIIQLGKYRPPFYLHSLVRLYHC